MDFLRAYLLAGLIFHKVVWEVLKRSRRQTARISTTARLAKLAKLAILAGILIQTLFLDILPITREPLQLQMAGTAIYTIGLLTAITARWQLGTNWSDIEAAEVKSKQQVVETGIYRYIRHPIYAGDLLLLAGLELALNSWLVLGVAALAPVVLRQALIEERLLVRSLPGYSEYCTRTSRFVPFVL